MRQLVGLRETSEGNKCTDLLNRAGVKIMTFCTTLTRRYQPS
jgi:hypothetical protein